MTRCRLWIIATSAALAATAGSAIAQPGSPPTPPEEPEEPAPPAPGQVWVPADANGDGTIDERDAGAGYWSDAQPAPVPDLEEPHGDDETMTPPAEPLAAPRLPPRPPDPPIELPEIISAPTGRLVPAGIIYSKSSLDTSFGLASDLRVGLGDVAEFGLASTELVRARSAPAAVPSRVFPYLTATFRMGVAEDRLFPGMPGMVLGFRKSFERNQDGYSTRIAELHLAGSKRLGKRVVVHAGAVFWDASIARDDVDNGEFALHERGPKNQLRPFGGLELRPLENALVLLDLTWVPEFCYECGVHQVELRPVLSWGVRYEVADWVSLQSGVRVADIADANLLDAQIFGQVTFVTRKLRHLVDSVKDRK